MGFFFRRKKSKQSEEAPKENIEQNNAAVNDDAVNSGDAISDKVIHLDDVTENDAPIASQEKATDNNDDDIEKSTSDTQESKPSSIDTKEKPSPTSLDSGLSKSSSSLLGSLGKIFSDGIEFSEDIFEDLEDTLISADIGVSASMNMIDALRKDAKNQKLKTAQSVVTCLQDQAREELTIAEKNWNFNLKPYVIMMVGVNGVGKTTTTAKIARHFQKQGKNVMLAAADTFRAAATEQLIEWGKRLDIPVIHQAQGSDAAAVAHDAFLSLIHI